MKIDRLIPAAVLGVASILGYGQTTPVYSYSVPSGGYAPNSNLVDYSDSATGTWHMHYDSLNRVDTGNATAGVYQNLGLTWQYDSFGNRLNQTLSGTSSALLPSTTTSSATYNPKNQMITSSLATASPTYDAAGNMTDEGRYKLAYDAESRVCSVYDTVLGGNITQYLYNAEGQRVAKGHPATSTSTPVCPASDFVATETYILGPSGEQVTQMDGTGHWQHTNVYAAGQLLATYDQQGSQQLLHFNITDALGTKRVQTSAAGATELTCLSLPFGDGPDCSGSGAVAAATEHRFTGKERDTESGLDYFGARYYASTMGRWMSPDPGKINLKHLANPQKWNKYAYVLNNPLTMIDPDGQAEVTITYRAFIPQANMAGFRGDNRSFSSNANASSRVSVTFRVETDPAKNGGNPLIGTPQVSVGTTHFNLTGQEDTSKGPMMPQVHVSQDTTTGAVTANIQESMGNPFTSKIDPNATIKSDVNITVNESATNAQINGTVSGSPAFESNMSVDGGATQNVPVQSAPTNAVQFVLGLHSTNQVNRNVDLQKKDPQ